MGDPSSGDLLAPAAAVSPAAGEAWALLAGVALPEGWRRELTATGFSQAELRFYRGDDWLFSAALNDDWVLFYIRKPAMRAGLADVAETLDRFPAARWKDMGEIKLRLHSAAEAQALWDWVTHAA